jgi:hypothetical protein
VGAVEVIPEVVVTRGEEPEVLAREMVAGYRRENAIIVNILMRCGVHPNGGMVDILMGVWLIS